MPSSALWNRTHREKMRIYEKNYRTTHKNEIRERAVEKRKQNPTADLERMRLFRERHPNYTYNYNNNYPEKVKVAWNFISSHPEIKGNFCEFCDSTVKLTAHHPDYDYPEIIVTCCASCHSYVHKSKEEKQP